MVFIDSIYLAFQSLPLSNYGESPWARRVIPIQVKTPIHQSNFFPNVQVSIFKKSPSKNYQCHPKDIKLEVNNPRSQYLVKYLHWNSSWGALKNVIYRIFWGPSKKFKYLYNFHPKMICFVVKNCETIFCIPFFKHSSVLFHYCLMAML